MRYENTMDACNNLNQKFNDDWEYVIVIVVKEKMPKRSVQKVILPMSDVPTAD